MTAPEPTLVNVESQHYPPLLLRHPANPILTRKHWPYSINSVFNAGATLLQDGTTLLLCRIEDRPARAMEWTTGRLTANRR
jgi:predicted GH43/DUF377 family glycosyl hydrolase